MLKMIPFGKNQSIVETDHCVVGFSYETAIVVYEKRTRILFALWSMPSNTSSRHQKSFETYIGANFSINGHATGTAEVLSDLASRSGVYAAMFQVWRTSKTPQGHKRALTVFFNANADIVGAVDNDFAICHKKDGLFELPEVQVTVTVYNKTLKSNKPPL